MRCTKSMRNDEERENIYSTVGSLHRQKGGSELNIRDHWTGLA